MWALYSKKLSGVYFCFLHCKVRARIDPGARFKRFDNLDDALYFAKCGRTHDDTSSSSSSSSDDVIYFKKEQKSTQKLAMVKPSAVEADSSGQLIQNSAKCDED